MARLCPRALYLTLGIAKSQENRLVIPGGEENEHNPASGLRPEWQR